MLYRRKKKYGCAAHRLLLTERDTRIPIMNASSPAHAYQKISEVQREHGKKLIHEELQPRPGDIVLDLGCGTGELSAYIAELVAENGKVLGVDPDSERIKLAQSAHKGIKNLTFVEGSTSHFPNLGSENFDLIYSNHVLHRVFNKPEALSNIFSSLKPGGKVSLCYCDHSLPVFDCAFQELNPENFDLILSTFDFQERSVIEEMCRNAGFDTLKSYDVPMEDLVYESDDGVLLFLWATTNGVFDRNLVTDERLRSFCNRHSDLQGKAGDIRLRTTENDFYSVMIAKKPAHS